MTVPVALEETITTPEVSILDVGRKLSLLTKELGLLDAIKRKLMKQPDRAAAKLTTVLQELLKSLLVFESEVVKFLSIIWPCATDHSTQQSGCIRK